MALAQAVRSALADSERRRSLGARARARRAARFVSTFPDLADLHVLDLGGAPPFWRDFPVRPARVTVLNLLPLDSDERLEPWIETFVGDACDPPAAVSGRRYDLVVSNSVIEHVGG